LTSHAAVNPPRAYDDAQRFCYMQRDGFGCRSQRSLLVSREMWCMDSVPPKIIRRPLVGYVKISVRALIVAVLVIGAGLGWLVRRSQVQRDAVAAITKAGGLVEYAWESPDPRFKPKLWWPKWLMEWVGVDHFGNVLYVDFAGEGATRILSTSAVSTGFYIWRSLANV
jgi:hypothetical protein